MYTCATKCIFLGAQHKMFGAQLKILGAPLPTEKQSLRHYYVIFSFLYVITGLPVWQTQSGSAFSLFVLLFSFFYSVSVKVLPVTPLLNGVFVHRAFCAYFPRIERVVGNA